MSEENTRIVCELLVEQVKCGNRSSTHLNNAGYKNVIDKFKEKTGLSYTRTQFKNKWSKLRGEYNVWKILGKQTGKGWDAKKGTYDFSENWWKKAKKVGFQSSSTFLLDCVRIMCLIYACILTGYPEILEV